MSDVMFVCFAPLLNFTSQVTLLKLQANMQIRPIRADEQRWMNQTQLGLEMRLQIGKATHVVETRQDAMKSRALSGEPFDAVIAMLRLIGPGDVGYNYVGSKLMTRHNQRLRHESFDAGMWSPMKPPPGRREYFFPTNKRRQAVRVFAQLEKSSDSSLATATDRFNFAYERQRPGDRIVDFWIALEGLFLPDGNQELRFRSALRISQYLGSDRWSTFRRARDSYDMRSSVVHGDRVDTRKALQVADHTEDILRRSIVKALTGHRIDVHALDRQAVIG